jgi:hypothetical protein
MAITEDRIGDIDERGFINSFDRKGFTKVKCISEIHANSCDAKSKNIKYVITKDAKTFIIDDGIGMNKQDIKNAFSVFKSNHREDQSMGVSGIGLKAALKRLSNDGVIKIITKKEGSPYYTINIDWPKIIKEGKYTSNIICEESNQTDIDNFNQDRSNDEYNKTGTTIIFNYDEEFHEILKQNFNIQCNEQSENKLKISSNQKLSVIFGKLSNIKTYYQDDNSGDKRDLRLYDYFSQPASKYYKNKEKHRIKVYKNELLKDDLRFIWEKGNEEREITKKGKGYSVKSENKTSNLSQYKNIGEYEVYVGVQYDEQYFNNQKPEQPKNTKYLTPLDLLILNKEDDYDFHQTISLYRNNQYIGPIIIPNQSATSSRANPESNFKLSIVHCEVHYFPLSHQNNELDIISGIQENKNQYQDNIPIICKRLFKEIKDDKAKEIWDWMESLFNPETKNKTEQDLTKNAQSQNSINEETVNQSQDEIDLIDKPTLITYETEHKNNAEQDLTKNAQSQNSIDQETINQSQDKIDLIDKPNEYSNLLGNEPSNLPNTTEDQSLNPSNTDEYAMSNMTNTTEAQVSNLTIEQPKIAINVPPYRKGKVTGKELIDQINKMNIDPEEEYTSNYIELFNLMSKINTELCKVNH